MKKLTTEEFINKAKSIYGEKFNYSKTNYLGTDIPVDVICYEHGIFSTRPHNFLKGHNCPMCSNRQRINTNIFIQRANNIHKGKYDYSKVDCKGTSSLVTIICPKHGEFNQKAAYHLNGNGCPKCYGTPKSTTEEFLKKAISIYGNKYNYSNVSYQGNKIKICITCKTHGDWWVTPNNFLRGSECPKCYGTPKHTLEEFIELSNKKHNNKYDYSKVVYNGLHEKVKIICPIHGEFEQLAGSHLKGSGCPECSGFFSNGERIKLTKETFLLKSKNNHSINYDYSKVEFNQPNDKVKIICPVHGEFMQSAKYHSQGGNCPRCAGSYTITSDEFIEKAKLIHGNKYNYSNVKYKNYYTKVCITCPIHGEFWQTPNNHLFGAGCPTCPQSNLEGEMREFLIRHNIKFLQEKGFVWLKSKKYLYLDFYLPEYNVAIECQGLQHFKPVNMFGGSDYYNKTLERDKLKYELCKKHNIDLLYFSNANINYPYKVYENYRELLEEIKKHKK